MMVVFQALAWKTNRDSAGLPAAGSFPYDALGPGERRLRGVAFALSFARCFAVTYPSESGIDNQRCFIAAWPLFIWIDARQEAGGPAIRRP
jgi:hypothetical protein